MRSWASRNSAAPEHNPRIVGYQEAAAFRPGDDETPWCGFFVAWCLDRAGQGYDRLQAAPGAILAHLGTNAAAPVLGCVVVFWRGRPDGSAGHVGFYAGRAANGDLPGPGRQPGRPGVNCPLPRRPTAGLPLAGGGATARRGPATAGRPHRHRPGRADRPRRRRIGHRDRRHRGWRQCGRAARRRQPTRPPCGSPTWCPGWAPSSR